MKTPVGIHGTKYEANAAANAGKLPTVPPQAGCFIAGTLVHTREGLKPIEQIKVGDYVLSKPENGGEQTYKRVTQTFRHENREVWRVQIHSAKEFAAARAEKRAWALSDCSYLICTPNHLFWVKDKGWMSLKDLLFRERFEFEELEFSSGELAVLTDIFPLHRTYVEGVAHYHYFGAHEAGETIDLRNGQSGEFDFGTKPPISKGYLGDREDGYEFFRTTVYNLEVEDNHSYYVGTRGIWVHHMNASKTPS